MENIKNKTKSEGWEERWNQEFGHHEEIWNGKKSSPEGLEAKDFIRSLLAKQKAELVKKLEDWLYGKTNYMTQMASKKNFDQGNLAKELASEVINLLKE